MYTPSVACSTVTYMLVVRSNLSHHQTKIRFSYPHPSIMFWLCKCSKEQERAFRNAWCKNVSNRFLCPFHFREEGIRVLVVHLYILYYLCFGFWLDLILFDLSDSDSTCPPTVAEIPSWSDEISRGRVKPYGITYILRSSTYKEGLDTN